MNVKKRRISESAENNGRRQNLLSSAVISIFVSRTVYVLITEVRPWASG